MKDKLGSVLTDDEIRSRGKNYCEDMYRCSDGEEEEEADNGDL